MKEEELDKKEQEIELTQKEFWTLGHRELKCVGYEWSQALILLSMSFELYR